jgi:hypothetical protein
MRTLMSSGEVPVSYGQIYVESQICRSGDMGECFGGQQNGLCGGALEGRLFLMTGMHTGVVAFTVEVHDAAPPIDDGWEDVVEVSFRPGGATALLCWAGEKSWPLDLEETDYRVRYSAKGMDQAGEADRWSLDDPEVDSYLLQLWPQPPRPDGIVKQTSRSAAYWHAYAQEQPAPPSAEERAAEALLSRAEREQVEEKKRLEAELRFWGGRLPDERIRRLKGFAGNAALLDLPLAEALAQAGPEIQQAAAKWLVRRTFLEAGLADVAWIAPALAAMDRGEPLPPPFDDWPGVWDRVFSDESVPKKVAVMADGRPDDRRIPAAALRTLSVYCFGNQGPLDLVLRILEDASWALPVAVLSGELRAAFAELTPAEPATDQNG